MIRSSLTVVVLQDLAHRSLQPSRPAAAAGVKARRMLAQLIPRATGFDADHFDVCVAKEWMKQANRVRAATDTRDQRLRQTAFSFQKLRARLASDYALKITHHQRIRMG